jgi:hypothetical protein
MTGRRFAAESVLTFDLAFYSSLRPATASLRRGSLSSDHGDIEGVGQPLGYYAHEMRRRGWNDVIVYLPHDGVATNNITGKRYIDHWIEAGFECGTPIKNTGAGAAMMRIEAARRVFPRCWFKTLRLKLDAMRSATTTSVRTRSAVSVWAQNTIGRAMRQMHSGI